METKCCGLLASEAEGSPVSGLEPWHQDFRSQEEGALLSRLSSRGSGSHTQHLCEKRQHNQASNHMKGSSSSSSSSKRKRRRRRRKRGGRKKESHVTGGRRKASRSNIRPKERQQQQQQQQQQQITKMKKNIRELCSASLKPHISGVSVPYNCWACIHPGSCVVLGACITLAALVSYQLDQASHPASEAPQPHAMVTSLDPHFLRALLSCMSPATLSALITPVKCAGVVAAVSCHLDPSLLSTIGGTAGLAAGLVAVVTNLVPVLTKALFTANGVRTPSPSSYAGPTHSPPPLPRTASPGMGSAYGPEGPDFNTIEASQKPALLLMHLQLIHGPPHFVPIEASQKPTLLLMHLQLIHGPPHFVPMPMCACTQTV
eukprot:1150935-Pelagomonas_calceolata.AAC.23